METFVDPARFQGTVYRAANWQAVGHSRGFRRGGAGYCELSTPKRVFLYPLARNVGQQLSGAALDPTLRKGAPKIMLSADHIRSLPDVFRDIDDPRTRKGRRHSLHSTLALATAATLCGARGYKAIWEWIDDLGQKALARFEVRRRNGVRKPPCQSTIRRTTYTQKKFGKLPLLAVERERVAAFHVRLNGVPYAANRAVALMSHMYAMAADWEMVPDGTNPCRSVRKYPARGRERFLTDTEFRRLGEVLGEAPTEGGVSVHAVAAIRLLMLTGCRKSEILSLQWTDIDLEAGELRLRESKTGPRAVPLSPPAAKVLAELPRVPGNPWVIPGQKPDTHMTNLDDPWRIVCHRAGIENVRIHDCRHSFASRALALGESLPVIAKLLGHSQIRTTARYAHLARDSVRASAARVAASIAEDFLTGGSATAKMPGRQGTDSSG